MILTYIQVRIREKEYNFNMNIDLIGCQVPNDSYMYHDSRKEHIERVQRKAAWWALNEYVQLDHKCLRSTVLAEMATLYWWQFSTIVIM